MELSCLSGWGDYAKVTTVTADAVCVKCNGSGGVRIYLVTVFNWCVFGKLLYLYLLKTTCYAC